MKYAKLVIWLVALCHAPVIATAQPSLEELLASTKFTEDDKSRVRAGELVSREIDAVSPRDLSISMAFVVRTSPAELAEDVLDGTLGKVDENMIARGFITREGSAADFAKLTLEPKGAEMAQSYLGFSGGDTLNLSSTEVAAFQALKSEVDPMAAVERQLRQMLLARYRRYRDSGFSGIAPYDRGGKSAEPVADLRAASEVAVLKRFFPGLQKVLVGYPRAMVTGLSETFTWANLNIDEQPTYTLTHFLAASEGDARIVVQRQFYVSRTYNTEQAVAAFFPVPAGTLVLYANHTFTDQVTGVGGSAKRSIGRKMMASKLTEMFEKERRMVER